MIVPMALNCRVIFAALFASYHRENMQPLIGVGPGDRPARVG